MTITGDLETMVMTRAGVSVEAAGQIVGQFFDFIRDGNTISFLIGEVGDTALDGYLDCVTALAIKCGHQD